MTEITPQKTYFEAACYDCLYEDNNVILTPGVDEGFTKCLHCQKTIYITVCQKCKETWAYSEGDKFLNPDRSYKCEKCKELNHLNEKNYKNFMPSLTFDQLPEEYTKKVLEQWKFLRPLLWLLFAFVFLYPLILFILRVTILPLKR